ncbi:MDR family MFS transporter [Pseudokineococcus marinus]|uniref:Multidrug efflux MFS transporter n=1 Tax=Pseudokineococcus marinus TaxID=351215 RepID=A0A849BJT8_9ACTN|nr:MDR family MFS transporter [Pseudokineococcus marinus]NNH23529.1 multidrug efflux MFS transporter [Pseudokineococcus marinus]
MTAAADPSTSPATGGGAGTGTGSPAAGAASGTGVTGTAERMAPGSGLVIGLLLVSAFVVILNETIMSVALPRLMEDLQVTTATAQWLTTGFMLTMAVVIPVTGFLLQRFHIRPLFLTAMSLFSTGTLVAALAPGFGALLVGRVVQASGTAIMMPLLFTTVLTLVPASSRGRMMGRISIVIAVAPAIGPTISGLVLSVLDWRWMFWLVLPIALVSLALGAARIRNATTPRPGSLDVPSVVLSALAFGGLLYGLSSIGEGGGAHVLPLWVPIAVGAAALAVFVHRQLRLARADAALLDLRVFGTSAFAIAVGLVVISMVALFGSLIVLPLYLQQVLDLTTLSTGLLLLPGGVVMAVLSPVVGGLFDRVGPRPLVTPGVVVVSAALWTLTTLGAGSSPLHVVAAHVLLSAGLAFVFTPLLTSALGSLPPRLYSHGSAVVSTVQQLAGGAGTALFVTLLSTRSAARLAEGADAVAATADGVRAAFLVGAVLSLVAVGVSLLVRRPAQQPSPEVVPH